MYKNKADAKAYARKHYERHKDLYKSRAKANNKKAVVRNVQIVAEIKENNCCSHCSENDPIVLDFHHYRGKKKNDIAMMVRLSYSEETLKEEIEKCKILCANCHRREEHRIRQSKRLVGPERFGLPTKAL